MAKSAYFFVITVFLFSLFLHFVAIDYPKEAVFDEVHFGKFVSGYLTGEYFFDIHPPLGKLMIAGMGKLAGFTPGFDFQTIGEQYPNNQYIWLRLLPALFGSLLIPLIFLITFRLSRSIGAACLAAIFMLFENALLVQSKFILIDSFLLFFGFAAIYFFLESRAFFDEGKWGLWSVIIASIASGFAISIKWTAVSFWGLILMFGFFMLLKKIIVKFKRIGKRKELLDLLRNYFRSEILRFRARRSKNFEAYTVYMLKNFYKAVGEIWKLQHKNNYAVGLLKALLAYLCLLVIPLIIYFIFFAVHFNFLPHKGPGNAYMSERFQKSQSNGFPSHDFMDNFYELNLEMFRSNQRITETHSYGSKWYTWPFMLRPVYYWNKDIMVGNNSWYAKIYLIGNPFVWWLSTIAVIYFFISSVLKVLWFCTMRLIKKLQKKSAQAEKKSSHAFMIIFLGSAYLVSFFPFIFIGRVMFLYHYLTALIVAIMISAISLTSSARLRKLLMGFLIAGTIAGFFVMFPITYGTLLNVSWPRSVFWLKSWI